MKVYSVCYDNISVWKHGKCKDSVTTQWEFRVSFIIKYVNDNFESVRIQKQSNERLEFIL